MSSPTRLSKSPVGIREPTRVILREITASLQNSPPIMSPGKKTNNDTTKRPDNHEVKVNFAREFAEAPDASEPSSISPASSFQSLVSTISSKSLKLSPPGSPTPSNGSYIGPEVSGLDDLIAACAGIHLEDTVSLDNSQANDSFNSASDELVDKTEFNDADVLGSDLNGTQVLSGRSTPLIPENPPDGEAPAENPETPIACPNITVSLAHDRLSSNFKTAEESLLLATSGGEETTDGDQTPPATGNEGDSTAAASIGETTYQKVKVLDLTFDSEGPSLPTLPSEGSNLRASGDFKKPSPVDDQARNSPQPPDQSSNPSESQFSISKTPDTSASISRVAEPTFIEAQKDLESFESSSVPPEVPAEKQQPEEPERTPEVTRKLQASSEITSDPEELDTTITFQESPNLSDAPESEQYEAFKPKRQSTEFHPKPLPPIPAASDYTNFQPHRQSTGLSDVLPPPNAFQSAIQEEPVDDQEFYDAADSPHTTETPVEEAVIQEKLRLAAETVAADIINASLHLPEEGEHFETANSNELFRDPSTLDFFESQSAQPSTANWRRGSLFIKFDPLVSDVSMLPQGNTPSPPAERNGDSDSESSVTTPKRNPAIAAIDRLLFYSPMPLDKVEVKKIEQKTPELVPVVDSVTARELQLVRVTVLQLEEQLAKEKEEREKERKESEKQKDTIIQLQKHLAQEIKSKNQINVVVDEYEKSISRLVAERERDKKTLDAEKSALTQELQDTRKHLMASEASFNDVHTKYERLKVVANTYRLNEIAFKESLADNGDVIKGLENRYEQIKAHACARLDKANSDLDAIRKQHESEMVKLRAILRKEELKSNSLNEVVEQKTKENKELTQILDEVIARVGAKSDE